MGEYVEGKPPILKDISFWKEVRYFLILVWGIGQFFIPPGYHNLSLIVLGIPLILSLIVDTIIEKSTRKSTPLIPIIIWKIMPLLLLFFVLFFVNQKYPGDIYIIFFVIAVYILLSFLLPIILREQINNSENSLKYLFGEKTPFYNKNYLKETGIFTIIINGALLLAVIVYLIWFIIARL